MESGLATTRQGRGRTNRRTDRRPRNDNEGVLPVLAQAVRRLENAVQRGRVSGSDYARYQAIALLAREERVRVRTDDSLTQVRRDSELKRLDGIATILAQIAASEPSFFHLLDEKADVSEGTRILMREMQVAAGREPAPEAGARGEGRDGGRARRTTRGPGRRTRPPAGHPLPGPRLLGRAADAGPPPARRTRADRAVAQRLRGRRPRGARLHGAAGVAPAHGPHRSRADAPPGPGGLGGRGRAPHLPARRRAGPRQDRPGAARRGGGGRLPAAGRRTERRQDQLGARGRHVDAAACGHRRPRRR